MVIIVRKYDVPYLAGASSDGRTVYIDRRVPKTLRVKRRNGRGYTAIAPDRFLALHEETEFGLMVYKKMPYAQAHAIATQAEKQAVEKAGIDWDNYEKVMNGLLAHIEHEKPRRAPSDLYTKPYPHDKQALLKKLAVRSRQAGGAVDVDQQGPPVDWIQVHSNAPVPPPGGTSQNAAAVGAPNVPPGGPGGPGNNSEAALSPAVPQSPPGPPLSLQSQSPPQNLPNSSDLASPGPETPVNAQGQAQSASPSWTTGWADQANASPSPADSEPDTHGRSILDKLLGIGGPRYELWPERLVRSALTAPGEVYTTGQLSIRDPYGRVTATEPEMDPNNQGFPSEAAIQRSQDVAALQFSGGAGAAEEGAVGSAGSRLTTPTAANPPFYSALEQAVASAPQSKMMPSQWLGWLKNQPGVRDEELQWMGLGNKDQLPAEMQTGPITKDQLLAHLQENQVNLGSVVKKSQPIGSEFHNDAIAQAHENLRESFSRSYPYASDEDFKDYLGTPEGIQDAQDELKKVQQQPRYSEYQLPGGQNYQEQLLTIPKGQPPTPEMRAAVDRVWQESGYPNLNANNWGSGYDPVQLADRLAAEGRMTSDNRAIIASYARVNKNSLPSYMSPHWDEPNVLLHLRVNDRSIPGVGDTLHLEELQSDWHQAGRKRGYASTEPKVTAYYNANGQSIPIGMGSSEEEALTDAGNWVGLLRDSNIPIQFDHESIPTPGVPNAPFKTTWPDLGLKAVIAKAAREGYDAISWTPGEQQAERYDLSKQLSGLSLGATNNPRLPYNLLAYGRGRNRPTVGTWDLSSLDELENIIGKEPAQKLVDKAGPNFKFGDPNVTLDTPDLKVGGEGMKAFYDKMLVNKANALGKKFGTQVEWKKLVTSPSKRGALLGDIPTNEQSISVPVLKITPKLRAQALKGMPLFTESGQVGAPIAALEGAPYLAHGLTTRARAQAALSGTEGASDLYRRLDLVRNALYQKFRNARETGEDKSGLVSHLNDVSGVMGKLRNNPSATTLQEATDLLKKPELQPSRTRSRNLDLQNASLDQLRSALSNAKYQAQTTGASKDAWIKQLEDAIKNHPDYGKSSSVWTPQNLDELRRLAQEGHTSAEIARRLGPDFTRHAVSNQQRRLGIPRPIRTSMTQQLLSASRGNKLLSEASRSAAPLASLSDERLDRYLARNPGANIFELSGQAFPTEGARPTAPVRPASSPLGLSSLGEQRLFNTVIGPHVGEKEFADKYLLGLHDPNATTVMPTTEGKGLTLTATLRNPATGQKIGNIERLIWPGDSAYHSYLEVVPGVSFGVVPQMLRNQIDLYNRMGIKYVDMGANITVGGYAWAKYGWVPEKGEWDSLRGAIEGRLNNLRNSGEISPKLISGAKKILSSEDPKSIWDLADISAPVPASLLGARKFAWDRPQMDSSTKTIGQYLLKGTSWDGRLNLHDPESMSRFDNYIKKKVGDKP